MGGRGARRRVAGGQRVAARGRERAGDDRWPTRRTVGRAHIHTMHRTLQGCSYTFIICSRVAYAHMHIIFPPPVCISSISSNRCTHALTNARTSSVLISDGNTAVFSDCKNAFFYPHVSLMVCMHTGSSGRINHSRLFHTLPYSHTQPSHTYTSTAPPSIQSQARALCACRYIHISP